MFFDLCNTTGISNFINMMRYVIWAVKRTGMQRRFGEISSGSLNLRKINKNCQHSNQITFSCHYMSVFSSLILSLPNFIVSVYSSLYREAIVLYNQYDNFGNVNLNWSLLCVFHYFCFCSLTTNSLQQVNS